MGNERKAICAVNDYYSRFSFHAGARSLFSSNIKEMHDNSDDQ